MSSKCNSFAVNFKIHLLHVNEKVLSAGTPCSKRNSGCRPCLSMIPSSSFHVAANGQISCHDCTGKQYSSELHLMCTQDLETDQELEYTRGDSIRDIVRVFSKTVCKHNQIIPSLCPGSFLALCLPPPTLHPLHLPPHHQPI